jgi:hypothetical protein
VPWFDDPRLAPQQFISPILFVDGHTAVHNFSKALTVDPLFPYEETKDWIWYKPAEEQAPRWHWPHHRSRGRQSALIFASGRESLAPTHVGGYERTGSPNHRSRGRQSALIFLPTPKRRISADSRRRLRSGAATE